VDSLTAHYLARELDSRWTGQPVRGILVDGSARRVAVHPASEPAVVFDLASPEVPVKQYAGAPVGTLLQRWTVRHVFAPVDDRRLVVTLSHEGRFRGSAARNATLEISAIPSGRAALLREAGGKIVASLGGRLPPTAAPRPLLDRTALESAVAAGDTRALLAARWMSVHVARWLVREPRRAWELYEFLCSMPEPEPTWCGDELLPFPMCENGRAATSLIISEQTSAAPVATPGGDDRTERARRRMRAELERATAAPHYRAAADALMALGSVPAPEEITVGGGTRVEVERRRGETAQEAATRLYATVRSMERALAQLPERLAALGLRDPATGADEPSGSPLPRRAARSVRSRPSPFRTYRSSGGLDIWVGRGAASNDELTFHAAGPDEIWLHARDNAGAHVVLRWTHDDAPPERDLREAAMLAAWHSKSRGSALVPVDWTRRKYVRKPRGGAPGLVVVQRCRTVFVHPDAQLERALRRDMRPGQGR